MKLNDANHSMENALMLGRERRPRARQCTPSDECRSSTAGSIDFFLTEHIPPPCIAVLRTPHLPECPTGLAYRLSTDLITASAPRRRCHPPRMHCPSLGRLSALKCAIFAAVSVRVSSQRVTCDISEKDRRVLTNEEISTTHGDIVSTNHLAISQAINYPGNGHMARS